MRVAFPRSLRRVALALPPWDGLAFVRATAYDCRLEAAIRLRVRNRGQLGELDMRVYHFLSEKWAIDDLERTRLKYSTFDDLNDPFELMCPELPTPEIREAFRRIKAEISAKLGLLCFSRNWNNPLLWSHYADRHRGICLGFDADEVVPVIYSKTRVEFAGSPAELTEEFSRQGLNTKFEGWNYEDEVRIFVRLDPGDWRAGLRYVDFGPQLQLKQIIVGPLCTGSVSLNAVLRRYVGEAEIIKARLAFHRFEVTEDKRGFWNRKRPEPDPEERG